MTKSSRSRQTRENVARATVGVANALVKRNDGPGACRFSSSSADQPPIAVERVGHTQAPSVSTSKHIDIVVNKQGHIHRHQNDFEVVNVRDIHKENLNTYHLHNVKRIHQPKSYTKDLGCSSEVIYVNSSSSDSCSDSDNRVLADAAPARQPRQTRSSRRRNR